MCGGVSVCKNKYMNNNLLVFLIFILPIWVIAGLRLSFFLPVELIVILLLTAQVLSHPLQDRKGSSPPVSLTHCTMITAHGRGHSSGSPLPTSCVTEINIIHFLNMSVLKRSSLFCLLAVGIVWGRTSQSRLFIHQQHRRTTPGVECGPPAQIYKMHHGFSQCSCVIGLAEFLLCQNSNKTEKTLL